MEKTKKCAKCGRILPLSEFNKNKRTGDGYQYQCRDCAREYWNEYYERQKQKKTGVVVRAQPMTAISAGKPNPNPKLAEFQPRELIDELRARNYKGKLYITREIIV